LKLRGDAYGGADGRTAYPLEVVKRPRAVWQADKPHTCRISVIDGTDGGYGVDNTLEFARYLKMAGVDLVDCSSGGISGLASVANRLAHNVSRQVPYAGQVRNDVGVPTMAAGLIVDHAQAEPALDNGYADLIGVGREALRNPNWALDARETLEADGFRGWPIIRVMAGGAGAINAVVEG
jgi:2,4-dienoyl-CoA reductase-like NADH-dependent reductase (Old Yellow Enzyme family)